MRPSGPTSSTPATSGRSSSAASARWGSTRCARPVEVFIAVWDWGKYLGEESEQGVDVCVSSWRRVSPDAMPAVAKATGNYLNSQLIKMEAIANGYVEGIALDARGFVSEGSGENIFLVQDGALITPPVASSILHRHHPRHRDQDRPRPRHPGARGGGAPRPALHRRRDVLHRHGGRDHARSARSTASPWGAAARARSRAGSSSSSRGSSTADRGPPRLAHAGRRAGPARSPAGGATRGTSVARSEPEAYPMNINDLLKIAVERKASDLHLKVGSHPVIRVDGELMPLGEIKRLMQEDTIAMAFSMMNARQKQRFKEELELDIAYSVPGPRPLPLQRLPAARRGGPGAARHPGPHPDRPRADAAARAGADLRGAARHDPLHGHHRLGQVDQPRGDDRLHQRHRAPSTSSRSRTRSSSSTATRSRSSTSARSTWTPTPSPAPCAPPCARTPT